MTNGLSHPYHLDESNFILGAAGVTFHFYFAFYYIYIGSGTTRFITVETQMLPGLKPSIYVNMHVYQLCMLSDISRCLLSADFYINFF